MQTRSIRLFIASTQGLVEILSLKELPDPDLHSVVTINHTSSLAGISEFYHDFVVPPQGIIKDSFGGNAYRLDLSENIDQGESWQLGVYIAHCLQNVFSSKKDIYSDTGEQFSSKADLDSIIIATGRIDTQHKQVLSIEELDKKCLSAQGDIRKWLKQNKKVLFIAPRENLRQVSPDAGIPLTPVSSLQDLAMLINVTCDTKITRLPEPIENDNVESRINEHRTKAMVDSEQNNKQDIIQNKELSKLSNKEQLLKLNDSLDETAFVEGVAYQKTTQKQADSKHWLVYTLLVVLVVGFVYGFFVYFYKNESGRGSQTQYWLAASHHVLGDCANAQSSIVGPQFITGREQVSPSSLNKICSINLLSTMDIKAVWLVSESKAIIPIVFAKELNEQDIQSMNIVDSIYAGAYANGHEKNPDRGTSSASDISSHSLVTLTKVLEYTDLRLWAIPLPQNRTLDRHYHLLLFTQVPDQADRQSLEHKLFQMQKAQQAHNTNTLIEWHQQARPLQVMYSIEHQLSL